MKNYFLFFVVLSVLYQCQSNNVLQTPQPVNTQNTSKQPAKEYFSGNWKLEKTYTISQDSKVLKPETACQNESYWSFFWDKEMLKQSKHTAKGNKCSGFSVTKPGRVTIQDSEIQYFIDDVLYTAEIRIISETKFSIISKDLTGGKFVETESVFVKK